MLRGLICQEYAGHYSGILTNVANDSFLIEKGKCYYYNDLSVNNEIIPLNNWRHKLKDIPVLALYEGID